MSETVYLDNAATSWPKPPETLKAIEHFHTRVGANPGRSGHSLSIDAGRIIMDAREAIAELFGIDELLRIIFTKNATEALNIVISGLIRPGDHVITTSMEHNSVMRPLRAMEVAGAEVSVVPCSASGELDPQDIEHAIRRETRAIIMTHASNVTGTIMPISDIGAIARDRGIIFCVDAAQTAGAVPIHISQQCIDLLAFSGHKSLYGPQGTGGLYIGPGLEKEITPLMMGGTGSRSEFEEQPDFLPDKYESGTPNAPGIAGLGAGVRFVLDTGVETLRKKEIALSRQLINGLSDIQGVRMYGVGDALRQTPVVSFTIDGTSPSEAALILDEDFGIMSRPGLHCAPSAHRTIGTFPEGTIRLSPGFFNTAFEVAYTLEAVAQIASRNVKGVMV
ncbi:MAG TPA: aminotransferase class V-fold PLP-dependent enzyme [Deltaproteobacteria bacterium]|nr:aminotransferase class V-fold PLP-dependent enzyme [Deltaproteobacteria bacterium]